MTDPRRALFGTPARLIERVLRARRTTLHEVKRAAWLSIARHHGRPLPRLAARVTRGYLSAYENCGNYQIDTDGERRVLEKLQDAEPKVVFDVGANEGDWSLVASDLLRCATIHAFELVPSTAAVLAQRAAKEPRIIVNRFGLADHGGVVDVAMTPSTRHRSIMTTPGGSAAERCTLRRGDDYAESAGIEHIDFLKVDAEGADHLVLNGLMGLLERRAIDVVQFEYGPFALESRFLLADFYRLFERLNYQVGKIFPHSVEFRSYTADAEDFRGLNYLAVRGEMTELIHQLESIR